MSATPSVAEAIDPTGLYHVVAQKGRRRWFITLDPTDLIVATAMAEGVLHRFRTPNYKGCSVVLLQVIATKTNPKETK